MNKKISVSASQVILAFIYGIYIYFVAGVLIIFTIYLIKYLLSYSIEIFKVIDAVIFEKFPPIAILIVIGFLCDAIVKFSIIKKSWNLENKEIIDKNYKRIATILGLIGAIIVIGFQYKLVLKLFFHL